MPARKPPLRNQKATHNCCFCPLLGYPDGCWTTMSSLLTRGGLPATGPKKEPSSGPFGAIHCTHPLAIDNRLTRHASSISKPVHAEYHTMSSSRKVVVEAVSKFGWFAPCSAAPTTARSGGETSASRRVAAVGRGGAPIRAMARLSLASGLASPTQGSRSNVGTPLEQLFYSNTPLRSCLTVLTPDPREARLMF